MSTNDPKRYLVQLSDYAKRHYVKRFEKKYPGQQWQFTLKSIVVELERANENIKSKKAETIHVDGARRIVKYYFRVAQTKDSAKSSGNRVIALVDDTKDIVTILLVYSKNEISSPNETTKWQSEVRDNFPGLRDLVQISTPMMLADEITAMLIVCQRKRHKVWNAYPQKI